jgi:hypothetical protein
VRVFSGGSSGHSGNVTITTGSIRQPQQRNGEDGRLELRSGNVEIRTGNCDKDTGIGDNSNSYCYAGAIKIEGGEGSGKDSGGGGDVELKGGFGNKNAQGGIVEIMGGVSANGVGGDLILRSGSNAETCHVGTDGYVAGKGRETWRKHRFYCMFVCGFISIICLYFIIATRTHILPLICFVPS